MPLGYQAISGALFHPKTKLLLARASHTWYPASCSPLGAPCTQRAYRLPLLPWRRDFCLLSLQHLMHHGASTFALANYMTDFLQAEIINNINTIHKPEKIKVLSQKLCILLLISSLAPIPSPKSGCLEPSERSAGCVVYSSTQHYVILTQTIPPEPMVQSWRDILNAHLILDAFLN